MNDSTESLARIAELYDKRAQTFGDDPRSLYWHGRKEQLMRLNVLADICSTWSGQRVLDVGCGFGDLLPVLQARGFNGEYIGVDVSREIVTLAKARLPGMDIQCRDILGEPFTETFDYVFASGTFNIRFREDMEAYIKQMMTCMHQHACAGVAVNFLSSYVDFEHEDAYHSNPGYLFDMAMRLGGRAMVRHDYMPYEFTLYSYLDVEVRRPGNVFAAWEQEHAAPPGEDHG